MYSIVADKSIFLFIPNIKLNDFEKYELLVNIVDCSCISLVDLACITVDQFSGGPGAQCSRHHPVDDLGRRCQAVFSRGSGN